MELPSGKATLFTVIAFIVGGVVIPILSEMRQSFNQTKELSHKEMNVNSQYLNVINDLSESGIQKQLELAKYFSCVSTDDKTRQGWLRYYKLKEKEFKRIVFIKDSLIKKAKDEEKLMEEARIQNDSTYLFYKSNLNQINYEIEQVKSLITEGISTSVQKNKNLKSKQVYIQYEVNDLNLKLKEALVNFGWKVPSSEKTKIKLLKNEIRYFNVEDYELAIEIRNIISNDQTKFDIKLVNMNAPQGQLEIWLTKNSIN